MCEAGEVMTKELDWSDENKDLESREFEVGE